MAVVPLPSCMTLSKLPDLSEPPNSSYGRAHGKYPMDYKHPEGQSLGFVHLCIPHRDQKNPAHKEVILYVFIPLHQTSVHLWLSHSYHQMESMYPRIFNPLVCETANICSVLTKSTYLVMTMSLKLLKNEIMRCFSERPVLKIIKRQRQKRSTNFRRVLTSGDGTNWNWVGMESSKCI